MAYPAAGRSSWSWQGRWDSVISPTTTLQQASLDGTHTPFWQVSTTPDGNVAVQPSSDAPSAVSIFDVVWERNHDLLHLVVDAAAAGRDVHRGVGVRVWVDGELADATMCVTSGPGELRFSFLATLPDPLRVTAAALSSARDLGPTLQAALSVFGESDPALWATVHYGRGADDRYGQMVASSGHDTFRRAVEAANG